MEHAGNASKEGFSVCVVAMNFRFITFLDAVTQRLAGRSSMSIEARNVMVEKVLTVDVDTPLTEAVRLMNKYGIGSLIVTKKGTPFGIVTERDFLTRVLAHSEELKKVKVEEVMSKPLVTGNPEMEIEEIARVMFQKKIKKLPLMEHGKLVGLVTLTDLLRIQPQLIKMYKIFTTDLAPKRMKKVFDYYLLVQPEPPKLIDIRNQQTHVVRPK
jgi:predicted transcriptional regulator